MIVVGIFLARVLSISKNLLHIIGNKIKKESWQLVKNQKLSEIKKCPKNSEFLV